MNKSLYGRFSSGFVEEFHKPNDLSWMFSRFKLENPLGGTLIVPPGTFIISSPIELTDTFSIQMIGCTVASNSSPMIRLRGGSSIVTNCVFSNQGKGAVFEYSN